MVGIVVLCTFVVKVEILAHVNGPLKPASVDVFAGTNALLVEYLVKTGDEVAQGAAVCRVVTDPVVQRQALVRRQLQATISVIEQDSSQLAADTLEQTRAALATLPPNDRSEEITAPRGGTVKRLIEPSQSGIVSATTPLATVYDLSRLTLDATIDPGAIAELVAEGQTVRVRLPGQGGEIRGSVQAVMTEGATKRAIIGFAGVAPLVHERFRSMLCGDGGEALATTGADIVVGHRSLFKDVFGRKK